MECVLRGLPDVVAEVEHLEDDVLIAYADGALEGPAEAECDRHLAVCAECRALLVGYRTPHDPRLDERAVELLHGAVRRHRRAWVAKLSLAAAILIVAAIGAWTRWGGRAEDPRYVLDDQGSGIWRVMSAATPSPTGPAEFVPHTQVSLNLQPEHPVRQAVDVALYTSRDGGALERVGQGGPGELRVKLGDAGGIAITGTADQLFRAGFGRYVVSIVVAPRGACADLAGQPLADARRACAQAFFWGEREGVYREVQPP